MPRRLFLRMQTPPILPPRSLFHTSFSPVSASKVPEWISGGFAGSAAASSIWAVDHSKGVVQVEANDGVAFMEYRRRCERASDRRAPSGRRPLEHVEGVKSVRLTSA